MQILDATENRSELAVENLRFGFIASRFNEALVAQMCEGATAVLAKNGVNEDQVDIQHVPGAFELPLVARQLADTQSYDAIIAFGIVIRGETPHFDFISSACAHGLMNVGLETGVPIIFGVLTTDNLEQATDRADPTRKNKGGEVGLAALEMALLNQTVPIAL